MHVEKSEPAELCLALDTFRRLHDDAKFLYENNRLDSAIILGLMAIEQAGKFYLMKWDEQKLNNHRRKQLVASHVLKAQAMFDGLAAAGWYVKHKTELSEVEKQYFIRIDSNPEKRETYFRHVTAAMVDAVESQGIGDAVDDLVSGRLFELRNDLLYGEQKSALSANQAGEHIKRVFDALSRIAKAIDSAEASIVAQSVGKQA